MPLDSLFSLTGKIIDLDLGQSIMNGDLSAAREMLALLVNNLQKEIQTLEIAKQDQNWAQIKLITHKIHGGSLYCGTPRLQQISQKLDRCLVDLNHPDKNELFDSLIEEIHLLCQAYSSFE